MTNFLNLYIDIMSSNPLLVLVFSTGLLILILHLFLPILCNIYPYYYKAITGKVINNWYLDKVGDLYLKIFSDYEIVEQDDCFVIKNGYYKSRGRWPTKFNTKSVAKEEIKKYTSIWFNLAMLIFVAIFITTILSGILEWLLFNYFTLTLLVLLLVVIHFSVIYFGKKGYQLAEDVRLLKKEKNNE